MNVQPSQQLLRLSLLLQLERRARAAKGDELAFLMVNETFNLVPYRQAFLWQGEPQPKIVAVSGVSMADRNAPLIVWLTRLCRALGASGQRDARTVTASDVPADLTADWHEWLPPRLIWLPLNPAPGALLLAREEELDEGQRQLLGFLTDAYGHAWKAERPGGLSARSAATLYGKKRLIAAGVLILLGIVAFIPVHQTALAPAEIVPRDPAVIRAPLEGVVDKVVVKPNQQVEEGQLLFNLDRRRLNNQIAVAAGALQAMDIELRQARQFAVVDQKVRASLPAMQGKYDQQVAEIAYLRSQLERIDVKSPRAGVVVVDDPNDWIGRPVTIGEKVMLVADPENVDIEARIAVADAIDLPLGAEVRLFLNIDPGRPRDGVLFQASYQSYQSPDGVLAYRLKARLAEGETPPRIGLKGTAKFYGGKVPFAYTVLRRPLAALRQWLGI